VLRVRVRVFIDTVRKEVNIIHDLIIQISVGMPPRPKRTNTKTAEQRIKGLYHQFHDNQISAPDLLRGLSFFVANNK